MAYPEVPKRFGEPSLPAVVAIDHPFRGVPVRSKAPVLTVDDVDSAAEAVPKFSVVEPEVEPSAVLLVALIAPAETVVAPV
jgi:hypothetical protein